MFSFQNCPPLQSIFGAYTLCTAFSCVPQMPLQICWNANVSVLSTWNALPTVKCVKGVNTAKIHCWRKYQQWNCTEIGDGFIKSWPYNDEKQSGLPAVIIDWEREGSLYNFSVRTYSTTCSCIWQLMEQLPSCPPTTQISTRIVFLKLVVRNNKCLNIDGYCV